MDIWTIVIIGVILALGFDFLNGMNDAANSIATIVSTKVLSPFVAVLWAAFFNFAAFFIFKTHVATTIGKNIVSPEVITPLFILAALIGAIIWVFICTRFGLPISVSHSLIGGLIGPGLVVGGTGVLVASGIFKVALFIVLSPLIGMLLSYIIMVITLWACRKVTPKKVDRVFRVMQLFSSAVFSLGHGSNDAQKTMGVITLLLFSAGFFGDTYPESIPTWVMLSCYSVIALGTITGGWKVIKTLGVGLTDLRPVHGFAAETAGAISVIGSSLFGIPVSTTHTITGSIMGVGMTRRLSAVRWSVGKNIVIAWVLTIPATMLVAMGTYYFLMLIFPNGLTH
ncbi:MAG: inorganic phosphate transporter [Bacteroidales bacterium]|jgi:PiT family inorganic phosphate transporter|nr:inorganic phosphate transporter [Bacteroidales bacterium]MDD4214839.1 inorganic phosphate transporter [Bacteroidales bacterium]